MKICEAAMTEKAITSTEYLKDWRAVLAYVEESGRKLKKSKLYVDIGKVC